MKLKKYQKHIILEDPIVIDTKMVVPSYGAIIEQADDKLHIETFDGSLEVNIVLGLCFMGGDG